MVEFVCDASVYGIGSPRLLAQLPPGEDEIGCAYVIEWRTHVRIRIIFLIIRSRGSCFLAVCLSNLGR